MWSPQSIGTPPDDGTGPKKTHVRKSTADLKDQMQAMIDLQNMQQQQYEVPPPVQLKPKFPVTSTTGKGAAAATTTASRVNNDETNQPPEALPHYPVQDGVGRGTLLVRPDIWGQPQSPPQPQQPTEQSRNTSPTRGSTLSSLHIPVPPAPASSTALLVGGRESSSSPPQPGIQRSDLPSEGHRAAAYLRNPNTRKGDSYGATDPVHVAPAPLDAVDRRLSSLSDEGRGDTTTNNIPPTTHEETINYPFQPVNIYHMEGIPPHQNTTADDLERSEAARQAAHRHDFQYGRNYDDEEDAIPRSRMERFCCCLWRPFSDLCHGFCGNPDLHRSATLGAIDGLVTGSTLVAALQGLNIWTPSHSSIQFRVWLMALSAAVAIAEAVCMAAGHIRTTHQGALAAWEARQEVTLQVQTNRSAAKGHLVDLLLQRGLLKIDAMSIADTLEGYPDVCVSLLAGESLERAPGQSPERGGLSGDNMASLLHDHVQPDWHNYDELDDPEGHGGNSRAVRQAVAEAWTEAIGMMLAFGVAAILPAILIWGVLPGPIQTHQEFSYVTSSYHNVPDSGNAGGEALFIRPTTLLLFLMSVVMMVLGCLKAFLTSSNSYFGTIVEGVLLLWFGYGTAYGVGVLLQHSMSASYVLTASNPSQ